jgi:hypothetical protein
MTTLEISLTHRICTMSRKTNLFRVSWVALILGLAGCGQAPVPPSTSVSAPGAGASSSHAAKTVGSAQHDHSEWWCTEHGVPEEECGLCNAKLAAKFQKKGDWCKEHDRPDSQCFLCHPEQETRYATKYEAKYGKKPPKPELR